MGFEDDCPSAAYEFVIESITDCAFSWPISAGILLAWGMRQQTGRESYVDSNLPHFVNDCDLYYELCARSSSRA